MCWRSTPPTPPGRNSPHRAGIWVGHRRRRAQRLAAHARRPGGVEGLRHARGRHRRGRHADHGGDTGRQPDTRHHRFARPDPPGGVVGGRSRRRPRPRQPDRISTTMSENKIDIRLADAESRTRHPIRRPAAQVAAEDDVLDRVVHSFDQCTDPRLAQVMLALVWHLHSPCEVRLTEDEWATPSSFSNRRRAYHRRQASGIHSAVGRPRRIHAGPSPSTTRRTGTPPRPPFSARSFRRGRTPDRTRRRHVLRCVRAAVLGGGAPSPTPT